MAHAGQDDEGGVWYGGGGGAACFGSNEWVGSAVKDQGGDVQVEPAGALVRLRAHAVATGRSATDVACDILDRRLRLEAD